MSIVQPDRVLLKEFVSGHAPEFSGDVLDVGGGTRRYAGLFRHVDSFKILDPDESGKPDYCCSAEEIPLQDNSIDGIICTQVLGDIWDVQKAVGEMCRVLKPNGLLLITESLNNELHDEPHDFWRYTPHSFKKLLETECEITILEQRGGYFALRAQQHIRRLLENKWLRGGKITFVYTYVVTRLALLRDRFDRSISGKKFAIGYNILAKKK